MVRIRYDGDVAEIETVEELGVVLDLVPPADSGAILAQVGKRLPELIGSDAAFLKMLGRVYGARGARKLKFLQYFRSCMARVVTSGETLRHALSLLAHDDDQRFLLEALGRDGVRACIRRMEDIAGGLEWLHGEMDLLFLELIGFDYAARFVKDGDNLAQLLKHLGPAEERTFIDYFGWKRILACIQTRRDLYCVLNALEEDDERTLIRRMTRKQLRHILTFDFHVDELCDLHLTRGNGRLVREKYYGKRASPRAASRGA